MKRVLSWTPLLAGVLLGLVRIVEQALAREADTGLLISGHPAVWLLWGLTLLYVLMELVLLRPFREPVADLSCSPASPALFGVLTAGTLLITAGGLLFFVESATMTPGDPSLPFALAQGIFALPSGALLMRFVLRCRQGNAFPRGGMTLLLPVLWCCLSSIRCLWDYSSDPVLDDYLPELLAILLLTIALLQLSSFCFREGKVRRTRLFLRIGTVFLLLSVFGATGAALLAGTAPSLDTLFLFGSALFLWGCDRLLTLPATTAQEPDQQETAL